jgi:mannosyl-oligosaccharide alpha-1,2-mannosidase
MILTPLAALALAFFPSGILAGSVQLPNIQLPSSAAANKAAVVDIFTRSYDGYR